MTTTFCAPVVVPAGMTTMATTVPEAVQVALMAVRLPTVTLATGEPAGGKLGGAVNVIVMMTAWPGLALPPGAATRLVVMMVVPALSKFDTDVRPTR